MATPGWTRSEAPFHQGEIAIHTRMGVREKIDEIGRRVIRDFLPEQHRKFFAKIPYIIVGSVDDVGRPWASVLLGNPGFISSPDVHTLHITAQPLFGDPFAQILAKDINIGLLGIELDTRRRNRLNGVVTSIEVDGFELRVAQSFGNCPKYIQARTAEWVDFEPTTPKPVYEITALMEAERSLIAAADTFFIATAYQAEVAGAAGGVDVSHRGGKPGFVRVDDDGTLTVPDFAGNYMFNTFGNLEMNPRAGLLFADFSQGDLLYLTGRATIVWEGEEIQTYEGAERLLKFHPEQGRRVAGSLPLRWSDPELSPFLTATGPWQT
ncbi:MAG: pyridoxamine 5'-phosphate oxidase family protein [Cyanobacteria bacterium J06641_5]